MDRHIEVIGIDHGWSGMKTASQTFTSGVKEITTEPAFLSNIVEFQGAYYRVGGRRLEVRKLKTTDQNFYILSGEGAKAEGNEKSGRPLVRGTPTDPLWGGKAGLYRISFPRKGDRFSV